MGNIGSQFYELGMNQNNTISPAAQARDTVEMNESKTLSVPVAGRRYFDLGRNASYDAAKRDELPVIRIGSRLSVPVVALERMLLEAGTQAKSADPAGAPSQPRGKRNSVRRGTRQ